VSNDEIIILQQLAERELAIIAALPQPVVRVCGPLTCDGPDGYARNAQRLEQAEIILTERGNTVWSFTASEADIVGKGFDHDHIVTYFHTPVLQSGLIAAAYFLPRWQESGGARREYELALQNNIEIIDFPEEWFAS
jgi:hypothetical protein